MSESAEPAEPDEGEREMTGKKGSYHDFLPWQDEKLREMYETRGLSPRSIRKEIGHSNRAIEERIELLGLTKAKRRIEQEKRIIEQKKTKNDVWKRVLESWKIVISKGWVEENGGKR